MLMTLRECIEAEDIKGLAELIFTSQGRLTEPFSPENMDAYKGFRTVDDRYPNTSVYAAFNMLQKPYLQESVSEHLTGALIQRLRHDEDALNWCVHWMFATYGVAGSDANLIKLIRNLDTQHKVALIASEFDFWGNGFLKSLFSNDLVDAINAVASFSRNPGCNVIDWLETNEWLSQGDSSETLCANGAPGCSAVLLESSPINTLARSLLNSHIDNIPDRARSELALCLKDLPIGSQLVVWLLDEMAGLISEVGSECSDSESLLSKLALRASGGVFDWSSLCDHEWNSFYTIHKSPGSYLDLLKVRDKINEREREQLTRLISIIYNYRCPDLIYTRGVDHLRTCGLEFLKAEKPAAFGRLMFEDIDANPIALVDEFLDKHELLIAASLYACLYQSYDLPTVGIDLLSIINHYDPDRKTGIFDYAIVKIFLMAHRYVIDKVKKFDDKDISLIKDVLIEAMDAVHQPWPDTNMLRSSYDQMPERLKGNDFMLALGMPLTKTSLNSATSEQRARSFTIELGL